MNELVTNVLEPDRANRVNPDSDIDLEWAEAFFRENTYMGQINTNDEASLIAGFEAMADFRQQYGVGNAVANVLSMGAAGFGHTTGMLGMWVKTEAVIKAERGDIPSPFIGKLMNTELAADSHAGKEKVLREIDGIPDVLVRVAGTERERFRELHVELDKETREVLRSYRTLTYSPEVHARYVKGLSLFKERSEPPYNVAYPKAAAIVAKDPEDGNDKMMLVTEKVDGLSLADALEAAPNDVELNNKVAAWLDGSSQYLADKSKGGDFLYDSGLRQYMYGVTRSDPEPKIYCVDLDMWFDHFDGLEKPDAKRTIGDEFRELAFTIDFIDQVSPHVSTSEAKANVINFINAISKDTQPALYDIAQMIRVNCPWAT